MSAGHTTAGHVTYDTRTGRILGLHHGPGEAEQARQRAERYAKVDAAQIGVITVSLDAFARGERYTVDTDRKVLVPAGEGGAGFSFGAAGRST